MVKWLLGEREGGAITSLHITSNEMNDDLKYFRSYFQSHVWEKHSDIFDNKFL